MTYFVSGGMYNPSQSTVVVVNNNVTVFFTGENIWGQFIRHFHV